MFKIGEYITTRENKTRYYFGQIIDFTKKGYVKCLMVDRCGIYTETYATGQIRHYSLEEMVDDLFTLFGKEEPYCRDIRSEAFLDWLKRESRLQKEAVNKIKNGERSISDPEYDGLTSAELCEIEQLEEYDDALNSLIGRLKEELNPKYKQFIRGEYVFTPIPNAFNNKVSYWISKKGYTLAVYAFTPSDSKNLQEMTTDKVLDGFTRVFEETIQRQITPVPQIGTPIFKNEDDVRIKGIIYAHGDGSMGYWQGFSLSDEEESKVYEVLKDHDTEGCSICGSKKDIADEILA